MRRISRRSEARDRDADVTQTAVAARRESQTAVGSGKTSWHTELTEARDGSARQD